MIDFGPLNSVTIDTFREPDDVVKVDGVGVEAIFDSRHFAVEEGEGLGASVLVTTIAVAAEVAAGITVAETPIVARGIGYVAKDKRPDGQGMVVIELSRA